MSDNELKTTFRWIGIGFFILAMISGFATMAVEFSVFGWILRGVTMALVACGIEFLIGSLIVLVVGRCFGGSNG